MWTPRYYGQFVLPLANESPNYVFSNFNLLIRSLSMAPSVPVLTGFNCLHCNFFFSFYVLLQILMDVNVDSSSLPLKEVDG